MKKLLYIMLFVIFSFANIYAKDTLAVCRIFDLVHKSVDTLEFSLEIKRLSPLWNSWANGTFQLKLQDNKYQYDPSNIIFENLSAGDLKIGTQIGPDLPVDSYIITTQTLADRLSVNVHGPESFKDAVSVDTSIIIDKFRIIAINGDTLPRRLSWILDDDYFYQATAYKIENDSTRGKVEAFYKADDNIEMHDHGDYTVRYDNVDENCNTVVVNFQVKYIGDKKTRITWETLEECENKGFMLYKGIKPIGSNNYPLKYDTLVGIYNMPGPQNQALIGLGTKKPGRSYEFYPDHVEHRNAEYCYKLSSFDIYNNKYDHDSACVAIPFAVITYAQPNPNPFNDVTKVEYTLDDNVYLTIDLVDLTGKRLARFMDKKLMTIGEHVLKIQMPELASAGLYDLIFIAYPISDSSIELSKAVVKLHYVR